MITAVNAEAGQVVAAGQSVMRLAREDEREVAISVPGEPDRRARRARSGIVVVAVGESAEDLRGARARDRAGGRPGDAHVRGARVDRSTPMPALQWGMTANVALAAPGRADAALLPLDVDLPARTASPRSGSTIRRRGKVALRPVDDRPVPRGRRRRHRRACADGDWIVAAGVHKLHAGPGGAAVRRRPGARGAAARRPDAPAAAPTRLTPRPYRAR